MTVFVYYVNVKIDIFTFLLHEKAVFPPVLVKIMLNNYIFSTPGIIMLQFIAYFLQK